MKKYTIVSNEDHPHDSYKRIAEDFKGTWDGAEMMIDNEDLKLQITSFEYMGGMFVGHLQMNSNTQIIYSNVPNDDENFVVMRIGYSGAYSKKDKYRRFNHDGIFLYNANQLFNIEYPFQISCQWITIRFPLEVFNYFDEGGDSKLRDLLNEEGDWFHYFTLSPKIEGYVNELVKASHNKTKRKYSFLSRALDILGAFKEKMEKGQTTKSNIKIHPDDFSSMVLLKDKILSDFTTPPNLNTLSFELGMSISKLNRNFKAVYQQPILQYFNQHRTEETYRQVKYSDKSLTEIADDLGYSHVGHLSRTFKKQFGYAPSSIRGTLQ
ncbi:AraC family transcriptional regulator [Flammeovirga sp. EKP202]|uniref:helix-turn-helix domain-containing protein n=1 Tax=Flammeovirga sp. EKP202 TaxID=2770592 RepID=UPI00165FF925|nr:AraC family transcriptional regulator [Flammeovirga sp. EKP202]MBD0402351.1 helix-turn-helix transcriptional regulator [Flammeovirga sp. EKP202]